MQVPMNQSDYSPVAETGAFQTVVLDPLKDAAMCSEADAFPTPPVCERNF